MQRTSTLEAQIERQLYFIDTAGHIQVLKPATARENMRTFMFADIDEYYIEAIKKYYAASDDRNSKIVDFSSRQPSLFMRGSEHIAEGKEDFCIIDHFEGINPVVFNYRFLVEGDEIIPFIPGIVLDSNVVSYLHLYVTDRGGSFRNTHRGSATHKLIKALATKKWDFNAFFYLLESASKQEFNEVFPYAEAFARSILTLQLMDDDLFIKTGRIQINPIKYEEYVARHGSVPFQTVSGKAVQFMFSSGIRDEVRLQIQVVYATLLKIALLNRETIPCSRKLQLFLSFYKDKSAFFLQENRLLPVYTLLEKLVSSYH